MNKKRIILGFLLTLVFVVVFDAIVVAGPFQPTSPNLPTKFVIRNPTSFILGIKIDGAFGKVASRPVGINCGKGAVACKTSFYPNTKVDLTAFPNTGYKVVGWTGCDPRAGVEPLVGKQVMQKPANTCLVTMNTNKMVSVKFQKEEVSLTCGTIFDTMGLTVKQPLVQQGKEALKNHDFILADQLFCQAAEADKTDSQAAFACGFTTFIKNFQSVDVDQILTDIGELPIDIQNDIFGTNGMLHLEQLYSQTPESESYKDYPMMPFSNLVAQGYKNEEVVYHVIKELIEGNKTILDLQENLRGIAGQLAIVHNYLKIAKNDPNFAFRFPMEMFYKTGPNPNEILILRADVMYADIIVQTMAFLANLYYKYEPALDLTKIVSFDCSSGQSASTKECIKLISEELMKNFNGEYGPMFGDLKSSAGNFNDLKISLEDLLNSTESFVGIISTKSCQSGFNYVDKDPAGAYYKQDLPVSASKWGTTLQLISQLKSSLTGTTVPLSLYNGKVSVNLLNFFNNPPDARKITDPNLKPIVKTGIPCGPGQPYSFPCGENTKLNDVFMKELLSGSIIFNSLEDFKPTPPPPTQ